MGIQGLLPLLKDIQENSNMSKFKGQTVGIDAYCWLHKGAYGCAMDLALGKPTRAYVYYVIRRLEMLISHNVTPILVFDGGFLPAKADTEKRRRSEKKKYKAVALAALNEGKDKVAFENFQRCCDITPEMASEVIKECYKLNVQCIVAPYEADAQLGYLMKEGITQLTISEDSDLLIYGCNKVMYKMTAEGDGQVIDLDNLANVKTVQLASFTLEKFRHWCMLSGCDYLPSIKGMGLMKAFKAIRRFPNAYQCIKSLKCNTQFSVPKDYEENFRKADMVFKYQLVFDIRSKQLVRLNDIAELDKFDKAEKDYAGPELDAERGIQIALGNFDPISGKTLGSLEDFASGDISQRAQKSSGWDIPAVPADTSSAFKFREKKSRRSSINDNASVDEQIEECLNIEPTTVTVSSPVVEASKSLKRLMDEDVGVPTREEKLRKLYGEELSEGGLSPNHNISSSVERKDEVKGNEVEEDLLFSPTPPRKPHNVFAKKTLKNKNTFKSSSRNANTQSLKIVTSKFFSTKVAKEKENAPLQITEEPVKTNNGSFLEYLDKTNVRGYEVRPPLMLSQISPTRSNERKTIEAIPLKKIKKKNIFAVKKKDKAEDNSDLNSLNENVRNDGDINNNMPRSNELGEDDAAIKTNIDFNITIPLDDDDDEFIANNENPTAIDNRTTQQSDLNQKPQNIQHLNNVTKDKCTEGDITKTKSNDGITNGCPLQSKKREKANSIHHHFQNVRKCKDEEELVEELDESITDLLDVQPGRGENKHGDSLDTTSCDIVEQSLKNMRKEINLDTTGTDDVKENCSRQVRKMLDDLDSDGFLSDEKEEGRKNDGEDDQTIELDEDPLPDHLKQQPRKSISKKESNKLSDYKIVPVVTLDEDPQSCSDEELSIVKSCSFPNSATKSKSKPITLGKCRPIGLSKKRKPSATSKQAVVGDGKLKQITFEKFAFKRKSVS